MWTAKTGRFSSILSTGATKGTLFPLAIGRLVCIFWFVIKAEAKLQVTILLHFYCIGAKVHFILDSTLQF
jgi:hypothetical protein